MTAAASHDDVVVLVDLPNLYGGLRDHAVEVERVSYVARDARLHFENLLRYLEAGRPVRRAVFAATVRPGLDQVLEGLRSHRPDVEVMLLARHPQTGAEDGVDEALHARLQALLDEKVCTVVVATGDGAGRERGEGFLMQLQRLSQRGFGIEVASWERTAHAGLRRFAYANGHAYLDLDEVYEQITFIAGGRRARPVRLDCRVLDYPRGIRSTTSAGNSALQAPARRIRDIAEVRVFEALSQMAHDGMVPAARRNTAGEPEYTLTPAAVGELVRRLAAAT
jgi:hypothetical protein